MDWSTGAALILAMSGVATLLASALYRRQDLGAKTLTDALKPVFEALSRHDKDHSHHYATGNTVLRLSQQLTEHEKRDDERFDEIRALLRESRDDIKELLGRPIALPTKRDYPQ